MYDIYESLKKLDKQIDELNERVLKEEDSEKREELLKTIDFYEEMRLSKTEQIKNLKDAEMLELQKKEYEAKIRKIELEAELVKEQKRSARYETLARCNPINIFGGLAGNMISNRTSLKIAKLQEQGKDFRQTKELVNERDGIIINRMRDAKYCK